MANPTIQLDTVNRRARTPNYFGKARREYMSKPRLYISPTDWNLFEDLIEGGRFNRPHLEFKKHLLEATLTKAGLDPKTVKAAWSQKAGCSCGCSPGFILTGTDQRFDIWAKYKPVDKESVEKKD